MIPQRIHRPAFLLFLVWKFVPIRIAAFSSKEVPTAKDIAYAQARRIRTLLGHDDALPFYQQLLTNNDDYSAASHLAASSRTPTRQDQACQWETCHQLHTLRNTLLDDYTHANIQQRMNIPPQVTCRGPVYLTPVAAGTCKTPPVVESKLDCLVTLFLLGICLRVDTFNTFLGDDAIHLLQQLGLAFVSDDNLLVVPYVHLFPLDCGCDCNCDCNTTTLILATDLHPRVLSTTTVGTQHHGPVMYIGPDSLALVSHMPKVNQEWKNVLDLCTGSGIQALAVLQSTRCDDCTVTCVDINPRALQFTRFNAALNGLNVATIQGDLITGNMEGVWQNTHDLILANPPFIPVPPTKEILKRYGLFSSGGANGEIILRNIIELAGKTLSKENGLLAIVSEFMNPQDPALLERLQTWWGDTHSATGVLLTNQIPLNDETYAVRRADSKEEYDIWLEHLRHNHISQVSPGLLFVQTSERRSGGGLDLHHRIVPKTQLGSIWTPSNSDAVAFVGEVVACMMAGNE